MDNELDTYEKKLENLEFRLDAVHDVLTMVQQENAALSQEKDDLKRQLQEYKQLGNDNYLSFNTQNQQSNESLPQSKSDNEAAANQVDVSQAGSADQEVGLSAILAESVSQIKTTGLDKEFFIQEFLEFLDGESIENLLQSTGDHQTSTEQSSAIQTGTASQHVASDVLESVSYCEHANSDRSADHHSQMVHSLLSAKQGEIRTSGPSPLQQQQQNQRQDLMSIVSTADEAINRKYRRHIALLLHSSLCDKNVTRTCTKKWCEITKSGLHHISNCNDGTLCLQEFCALSKELLPHWKSCFNKRCSLCVPLVEILERSFLATNEAVTHWKTCTIKNCQRCAALNEKMLSEDIIYTMISFNL